MCLSFFETCLNLSTVISSGLSRAQHGANCFEDIHLHSYSASMRDEGISSVALRATFVHTPSRGNSVINASRSQIRMKSIASIILAKGNSFFYATHATVKI